VRLAAHDVALGHWTFLRILWQRDGMTQRELSLEAGVMEPTTLHALRGMEARGWVRREQRAGNRKNLHVRLTPAGRRLRDVLVPLAEEVNALAVAGVPPADLAATRRALLTMVGNLARDDSRSEGAGNPADDRAAHPPPGLTPR
jgi:DNA-binding MarR family transcriptional regulator